MIKLWCAVSWWRSHLCLYLYFQKTMIMMMDCESFLLSGSRNCPRYSWKRHGQPHRLAAQCGHDAAAYGSSRSRQEDWNSMLWHHSWQKGNLLLKKLRHDPFGYMPLFSFVMFLLSVFKVLTKDLGGNSKCSEFTEAICQRVRDMNWKNGNGQCCEFMVGVWILNYIIVVSAHFKPKYVFKKDSGV